MTAATLWYRGSVIERKSESPFASSCGSATAARPGDSTKRKRSGSPSQSEVGEVLSLGQRREDRARVGEELFSAPTGEPPTSS